MRRAAPFLLLPLGLLLSACAPPAGAGEAEAAPKAAPPSCSTPQHRQFDFWVGRWEVFEGEKRAGANVIEASVAGCVVTERWSGEGGVTGTSLNFYDREAGAWRQLWVDSQGGHLDLRGGLEGGSMVMTGESGDAASRVHNRITWTPGEDGAVRQRWEVSRDGVGWKTLFDGRYQRAP